jgi:hypothetical protein
MSVIDEDWLRERVAAKKALIVAFEDAITALSVGGVQSYRLMTGQTDQMVTRANLTSLRDTVSVLESEISSLDARICGASSYVQPGF